MFSVVPGVNNSDVSSDSEEDNSGSDECGEEADEHDESASRQSEDASTSQLSGDRMEAFKTPQESQAEPCLPPSGVSDQNWEVC